MFRRVEIDGRMLTLKKSWIKPDIIYDGEYRMVYKVKSTKDRKTYILKVIDKNNTDPFHGEYSFDNEIKFQSLAAQYDLAPKVMDSWTDDENYYIVSESVKMIDDFDYDKYEEYLETMVSQLSYMVLDLHEHLKITHGDIRTSNLGILNDKLVFIDFEMASYTDKNYAKEMNDYNMSCEVLNEFLEKIPDYLIDKILETYQKLDSKNQKEYKDMIEFFESHSKI